MALITAAEAKDLIPSLTGTTDDTLLTTLANRASVAFARFCGYPPATAGASPTMESASYVIEHNGSGTRDLMLLAAPATAVSAARVDPTQDWTDAAYLVTAGTYAIIDGDRLRLKSTATQGTWTAGERNVQVSFTAGYATVPADLKHLAARVVGYWYDQRQIRGRLSTTQGGQGGSVSATYRSEEGAEGLPDWARAELGAFALGSRAA